LFFIKPTPAKRASCPTKLAEALACGLPIVCNRGIGDLDDIVERENVGVLVDSMSDSGYDNAVDRLALLFRDPELRARCRRLAETRYNLETAVQAYHQLYREIA
jgi:glycosyltransferase involved in cell wall biosynthesis